MSGHINQSSGLRKGHFRSEYAQALQGRTFELEEMVRFYDTWKISDEGKKWLSNIDNAGKVPDALVQYAEVFGLPFRA